MGTKYSKDVVSVTIFKMDPNKVIRNVLKWHRPVLLTSRGKGVAVVQSLADYEKNTEEIAFMRAVVDGCWDVKLGRTFSLTETKARFGLASRS